MANSLNLSTAIMGKLTTLKPSSLSTLAPRLSNVSNEREAFRSRTQPWRSWYWTQRWRTLAFTVFKRDRFICRMCGKAYPNRRGLVCDHIRSHHGNEELFWSEANLQTLCSDPCHNKFKRTRDLADARK